jgi:prophage regulatory protein
MQKSRFLTVKAVVEKTSLSRATIDRKVEAGEFPAPIKISDRRKCFDERSVEAWMASKIVAA